MKLTLNVEINKKDKGGVGTATVTVYADSEAIELGEDYRRDLLCALGMKLIASEIAGEANGEIAKITKEANTKIAAIANKANDKIAALATYTGNSKALKEDLVKNFHIVATENEKQGEG